MKYKIYFLSLVIFYQTGCGVELRDRNPPEEVVQPAPLSSSPPIDSPIDLPIAPPTELRVENEYSLPIPLVPSQQIVLRYDRLILGPKAQLMTQGLNVRLEVKELIANDSIIRSFKSDQIAAAGFNGRSGGHIEIFAEQAMGNLTIILQGERGGDGLPGPAANETLRGRKGAKGLPAKFGTPAGMYALAQKAEDGYPGGQGLIGFTGGTGYKGGNSGTALIKIVDAENLLFHIQKNPGGGGQGGRGGEGGPGGFGGDPGMEMFGAYTGPEIHEYAVIGPPGIQGPQGLTGNTGSDGLAERSCVQVNNEDLRCE